MRCSPPRCFRQCLKTSFSTPLCSHITRCSEARPFAVFAIRRWYHVHFFSSSLTFQTPDAPWVRKHRHVSSIYSDYLLRSLDAAYPPVQSTSTSQTVLPPSRPSTPLGDTKAANGALATGTSTPTSVKADGFNYLDCVNCNRPVS